ncbi:MAG: phytanoyl-CoA dioxygenase family protein [Hyphomicrobiales bacterium]
MADFPSFTEITAEAVAAYRRDGVMCLRGAFDPYWIDLTIRGIERNMANPGRFFRDQTPEGSPGRYMFEYWSWRDIPEFVELVENSPAAEIAGRLMDAAASTLIMDNWFMKEAGAANGAPWHHDKPYFDFEGTMCNVWFPLEDASAEEGLSFVKGSHLWPEIFKPMDFREHTPFDGDMTAYADMPDIDAQADAHAFLSWDVAAGDCLVFDLKTVHGAAAGRKPLANTIRRMSLRFAAEDAVFKPRGTWTEETAQHLIGLGQKVGGPLDCDLLPTVWRA